VPAWIIAVLGLFATAYHVTRWYIDQRSRVDKKLSDLQDDMVKLRDQLERGDGHPGPGVREARAIVAGMEDKLASAKAITASKHPPQKPMEDGGYGE
jgi:hypothetical protein